MSNLKFLDRFYNEFITSSHEVAQAFAQTDMERQKAMLNVSMYHLMTLYEKSDEAATKHMEELGAIHGDHGIKIPPHLYDLWLESLLVAVSVSDPEYDEELEKLWREVMLYGIEIMKTSAHLEPNKYLATRLTVSEEETVVDVEALKKIIQHVNQLAKEAAHRSNMEKDLETTAFQFGQYRAYLHVRELMVELLKIKHFF